jgi:hypothetical protein
MPQTNLFLRVLNLQDLEPKRRKKRAGGEAHAERATGEAAPNPWLRGGNAFAEPITGPELPWHAERVEKPRWYWKVLRVVLIVALFVVVLVGLRTMFFPQSAHVEQTKTDPAAAFPGAAAAGVADRFATNFLTWNQDDPSARVTALKQDVGGLSNSDKFGWDGTSKQAASSAYTIAVDATSATDATVTVAVDVTPYDKDGKALPDRWQSLAVPVHIQGARPVVVGQPAIVALPDAQKVTTGQAPAEDTALGDQTESYAKSFFDAYGATSDVSAVSAPTAHFAGLDGAVKFQTLTSWTVYTGSGDTRQARAVVTWKTSGGSTVTSTYAVSLARVTAGTTARWQVAAITASRH